MRVAAVGAELQVEWKLDPAKQTIPRGWDPRTRLPNFGALFVGDVIARQHRHIEFVAIAGKRMPADQSPEFFRVDFAHDLVNSLVPRHCFSIRHGHLSLSAVGGHCCSSPGDHG